MGLAVVFDNLEDVLVGEVILQQPVRFGLDYAVGLDTDVLAARAEKRGAVVGIDGK